MTDVKLRGSYGTLGDDRNPFNSSQPIVGAYSYLEGYNYNMGTAIIDGNAVTVSRDKGIPITNISWVTSKITDIGLDFSLFNGKLTGTVDYFYRKRTTKRSSSDYYERIFIKINTCWINQTSLSCRNY